MVIRQYQIDYLGPTHLGDDVIVTGQTKSVGTTSCVMDYGIWCAGLKAKASAVLVFLDKQNQPTRIPADLRRGMMEMDRATSSKR
jgi:acyl-CoA thioesterase FadM